MSMPALPHIRGALTGLLLAGAGVIGCGTEDPVSRGHFDAFGSTLEITLIGVDRQQAAEITQTLKADLQYMESVWHAWNGSAVPRMNVMFNRGSASFAAPPSVLPLLHLAKSLSEQSDELFNPAIGHLYREWGFQGRPARCLRPPEQETIDLVLAARPSMRDIEIDGFHVSSRNKLVKLDFRGIQRGFAIDRAIARLQEFGVQNASINAGGDLRAIGSRDGHPWSIAIRGPGVGGVFATLKISGNEAAFTARPHISSFTWDGETYHEIIDPRTGHPAKDTRSVTVLHANASTADAAATALFIAGPKDWHRVARQMGVRYVMLTDSYGQVHMNPAMQARVKLQNSSQKVIISEPLV